MTLFVDFFCAVIVPSGVEFLTGHNAHAHPVDESEHAPSNGSEMSIEDKA